MCRHDECFCSRSKHSKHKSSDEDSEVLGGRSSDDVSRDRENDDKNRRRRRWENDEEPRNEDEDSRRTRRGKGDKENSDQDGSRGGPKGGKYWKKGFGSSWHHEDHDNPVGSPPNLSSKDVSHGFLFKSRSLVSILSMIF